jgi:hypothetical protein
MIKLKWKSGTEYCNTRSELMMGNLLRPAATALDPCVSEKTREADQAGYRYLFSHSSVDTVAELPAGQEILPWSPDGSQCTQQFIAHRALLDTLRELRALPRGPVELTCCDLCDDSTVDCGALRSRVSAPFVPSAQSLELRAPLCVFRGQELEVSLALSDACTLCSDYEARAVLDSIGFQTIVVSLLMFEDQTVCRCVPTISVDYTRRSICMKLVVPEAVRGYSGPPEAVIVHTVTVAGGNPRTSFPLPHRISVCVGLQPPIIVPDTGTAYATLAVSAKTRKLYAPSTQGIAVIDASGSRLSTLRVTPEFQSELNAIAIHDASQELVLGFQNGMIAAVNSTTGSMRWSSTRGSDSVLGIAVLQKAGIVIAAASSAGCVNAYRMSDGNRVASFSSRYPIHVATDPVSEEVIFSGPEVVTALRWTGSQFKSLGVLRGLSRATNHLLLTVIPAASGMRHSHLVVASFGSNTIDVISLPSHTVIRSCILPNELRVVGFAADPYGKWLGVCCSGRTHILHWPLEGLTLS